MNGYRWACVIGCVVMIVVAQGALAVVVDMRVGVDVLLPALSGLTALLAGVCGWMINEINWVNRRNRYTRDTDNGRMTF